MDIESAIKQAVRVFETAIINAVLASCIDDLRGGPLKRTAPVKKTPSTSVSPTPPKTTTTHRTAKEIDRLASRANALFSKGASQRAIARALGVSRSYAISLVNRALSESRSAAKGTA